MSSLPHFYYSPDILKYDFGPGHPLKPERLRRTIELLGRYGVEPINPGKASISDLLRVHDEDYVLAVRNMDSTLGGTGDGYGFGRGDNPVFPGMFEASLAYVGATARAAEAVRDGANLAYGIGGGLHHAHRDRASGFCIFNDPAIACHILREKFDRVAYVDIDVHHGDGVQWLFYEDPSVLTCSIHEEGRTLFPGTGFVEEVGADFSSVNVPLMAKTTADVWLDALERGILPAIEAFCPSAIVLQLGTDSHREDPLGHIRSDANAWLTAVRRVRDLGLPTVVLGGGGYNLSTVPRMWAAACLTMADQPFDDHFPEDLAEAWGVSRFLDAPSGERNIGAAYADGVIDWQRAHLLPNIKN